MLSGKIQQVAAIMSVAMQKAYSNFQMKENDWSYINIRLLQKVEWLYAVPRIKGPSNQGQSLYLTFKWFLSGLTVELALTLAVHTGCRDNMTAGPVVQEDSGFS